MAEQEMTPEQVAALQERLKQMSPEQIQELVKKQCIFCRIISGEIPAKTIYEDDQFVAFLDINPANLGHILVVPKDHFSVLPQMPNEIVSKYFILIKELSGKVFDALGAKGVNILQNNGPAAGQEVPHVHVHIIPRFEDDGVRFGWEPKKAEESEINAVVEKLKAKAKEINLGAAKPQVVDRRGRPVEEDKEVVEEPKEELKAPKKRLP